MTSLATLRKKLLTDPEVRAEYDRLGPILAMVGQYKQAAVPGHPSDLKTETRRGIPKQVGVAPDDAEN